LLHFACAPPRRAIPGVLHLNRAWTPPPPRLLRPRPAPSPPELDRLLHADAAAPLLLHPRPADPGPSDPGRQRPLRLLCTASFKYSPAVDGCTRRRPEASAPPNPSRPPPPSTRSSASSFLSATGSEVEARERRQPRSGDLLQPRSPPSSSPSFPGRLYLTRRPRWERRWRAEDAPPPLPNLLPRRQQGSGEGGEASAVAREATAVA
jgi:hypothetical protein